MLKQPLGLTWPIVAEVTLAFVLLEPPAARLAHRVGWRKTPY